MERKPVTQRQMLAAVLLQMRWVQQHIKLERWPPATYARRYGKRSISQILEQQTANYMNPCLDLTLATLGRLRTLGLQPMLVVEQLIGEHTGKPTLHYALEVELYGTTHTIDFPRGKMGNFYEGTFQHDKAFPHLQALDIQRMPTTELGDKTKPQVFFGIRRLREIKKAFPHVKHAHVRAAFAAMAKADSPDLHERVLARPKHIVRGKKYKR